MNKKLFFIALLFFLSLQGKAQEQRINEYYIIPEDEITIDFNQVGDRIILNSSATSINNFFNNSVIINNVEKAFPTSQTKYLQKIYLITLSEPYNLENIKNIKGIKDAYLREESIELSTPDDYIDFDNSKRNTALELVRAPLAWSITNGDPNIAIGISDWQFDKNHEELVGKIIFDNNTSYSTISNHGSRVAAFAAGNTNNGLGSSWIGYNSKLAISDHSYNNVLLLSQVPGVRVINISMLESCQYNPIAAAIYKEVWEGNALYPPVVIVAASGNGSSAAHINYQGWCAENDNNGNLISWNGYVYPASYDHVISVGSISHLVQRYVNDPVHGNSNWEDLILNNVSNQYSYTTLNDKVDIFAPGFKVLVAGKTINNVDQLNGYTRDGGTSFASPMVAGAAALILSANPNLTPNEVRDILVNTADPIYQHPENATFIDENGPGRLNAFRAVLTAKCIAQPSTELDLMVRDNFDDFGQEPNVSTNEHWESVDMWVRNQNDGKDIRTNENPKYTGPGSKAFIYVRVTNKSCVTSTGNEDLELYWAKASTTLDWPVSWNGNLILNGKEMGNQVGTIKIPSLEPGEDTIIEFEWDIPNPDDYNFLNNEPWHYCLLSRINTVDDPMTVAETTNTPENVKNNNNIGWKNISIIKVNAELIGADIAQSAVISVGNLVPYKRKMRLNIWEKRKASDVPLFQQAELKIKLSPELTAFIKPTTIFNNLQYNEYDNTYLVKGDNSFIENLELDGNVIGTVTLSVNFLADNVTDKNDFDIKITQYVDGNNLLGGETFLISKDYNREIESMIDTVNSGSSTVLKSSNIYPNTVYNWYDSQNQLLYSGSDFTINSSVSALYKLEVLSLEDGFKDYSEIVITGSTNNTLNVYPNPTNSVLNVDYDLQGGSGYINITKIDNSVSNNYILNNMNNTIAIDVSNYANGYYNVAVVKNGNVYKSAIFIKN